MISEPYLDCFGNRKRISRKSPASEEGREKLIASDLHKGSMKVNEASISKMEISKDLIVFKPLISSLGEFKPRFKNWLTGVQFWTTAPLINW